MSALDTLKGDIDPLTKRIVFTGILTAELEKEGFSPVAAGNYAVELYTSGGYKGGSVDVVAPIELIDKVLTQLDFKKGNGSWSNEDVDIAVNVLAEDLEEHQLERVNQIDIDGLAAYLLGVEDVILSKLKDFSQGGESNAIIWVQELMEIHVNEIDLDYLKDHAAQEGVMGALQELIDELRLEEEEYLGRVPQP
ncbi:MAG TPA: DUF6036 family nucleotidyltransferase [Anaerolineae bacterium]|nr:DUF6036 family nucleotidyltransferase [Anaerolineae bacterium]